MFPLNVINRRAFLPFPILSKALIFLNIPHSHLLQKPFLNHPFIHYFIPPQDSIIMLLTQYHTIDT